jgi:hypothetical protein
MTARDAQTGQTIRFKIGWKDRSPHITVQVENVETFGNTTVITGRRITRSTRNAEWTTTHRRRCFATGSETPIEVIQCECEVIEAKRAAKVASALIDIGSRGDSIPVHDSSPGVGARNLALNMHADSVNLWNRYWREAGEDVEYPQRDKVEQVQRLLAELAYDES